MGNKLFHRKCSLFKLYGAMFSGSGKEFHKKLHGSQHSDTSYNTDTSYNNN